MGAFRSTRPSNRQTWTAQNEHDILEGIPVRHWLKEQVNLSELGKDDTALPATLQNGYKELPLPRDFYMLPESSQALLRAARMGVMKKDNENDSQKAVNTTEEVAPATHQSSAIIAPRWILAGRDSDNSEQRYLAERRKGLSSTHDTTSITSWDASQLRSVKLKRSDESGKETIFEVFVPFGQCVSGEVDDNGVPTAARQDDHIALGQTTEDSELQLDDSVVEPEPTKIDEADEHPAKRRKISPGVSNAEASATQAEQIAEDVQRHSLDGELYRPQGEFGDSGAEIDHLDENKSMAEPTSIPNGSTELDSAENIGSSMELEHRQPSISGIDTKSVDSSDAPIPGLLAMNRDFEPVGSRNKGLTTLDGAAQQDNRKTGSSTEGEDIIPPVDQIADDAQITQKEQIADPISSAINFKSTPIAALADVAESDVQRIDVEAAPKVEEPQMDAEIPAAHNPLDGLKAPEVPPAERQLEAYRESQG